MEPAVLKVKIHFQLKTTPDSDRNRPKFIIPRGEVTSRTSPGSSTGEERRNNIKRVFKYSWVETTRK